MPEGRGVSSRLGAGPPCSARRTPSLRFGARLVDAAGELMVRWRVSPEWRRRGSTRAAREKPQVSASPALRATVPHSGRSGSPGESHHFEGKPVLESRPAGRSLVHHSLKRRQGSTRSNLHDGHAADGHPVTVHRGPVGATRGFHAGCGDIAGDGAGHWADQPGRLARGGPRRSHCIRYLPNR